MLPSNQLSITPRPGPFSYPVKSASPVDLIRGWELGGLGLNNPTLGLLFQVWTCTAELDISTNDVSVFVQAPVVAKTLLFTANGITSVDIAFDQNMRPFVAYKQGALWKYWWYDPTVQQQIHSTLAGARDLRCCLDDHNSFGVSSSDILLCYINTANQLCARYQRDRYAIEYVLTSAVPENLVYVGRNSQSRVQFGLGYLS